MTTHPHTHNTTHTYTHTPHLISPPHQADRGALRLDLLFAGSLEPLGQAFEETGYKSARTDLAALRQAVTSEVGGQGWRSVVWWSECESGGGSAVSTLCPAVPPLFLLLLLLSPQCATTSTHTHHQAIHPRGPCFSLTLLVALSFPPQPNSGGGGVRDAQGADQGAGARGNPRALPAGEHPAARGAGERPAGENVTVQLD